MSSKKKKPKHNRLVIPDVDGFDAPEEESKADRLGRVTGKKPGRASRGKAAKGGGRPAAAPPQAAPPGPEDEAFSQGEADDSPADNTIVMPLSRAERNAALKSNPKIAAIRRKKLRRKFIPLFFLLFIVLVGFIYLSGIYLPAWTAVSEMITDMRLSSKPGDGFPVDFTLPEYIESKSMGSLGFAVLGKNDLAVVSSTGKELQRIQHGYINPCITTGNKRVCVYGRGSGEYTILGRDSVLEKQNVGEEIMFAEMSPAGYLALVTNSRYQATLCVYSPVLGDNDWIMRWPLPTSEEMPISVSFHSDNRTLALASVFTYNGILCTNIHIAETNKATIKATINVDDAIPLHLEFLSAGRILVIFDKFAAVYSTSGEELHRFSFDNRSLLTLDSSGGKTALVFGASTQESVSLVLLNEKLEVSGSVDSQSTTTPKVLVNGQGVLMLCDYEVSAYNFQGVKLSSQSFTQRPSDMVSCGGPLLILPDSCISLNDMFSSQPSPAPTAFDPAALASPAPSPPSENPDDSSSEAGSDTDSDTGAGETGDNG